MNLQSFHNSNRIIFVEIKLDFFNFVCWFRYIKKYFITERSIKSGETDPKFHQEIRKRAIPVTGKKGTVLLFDPLCLHYSDNNNSVDNGISPECASDTPEALSLPCVQLEFLYIVY